MEERSQPEGAASEAFAQDVIAHAHTHPDPLCPPPETQGFQRVLR